ncbi:hypothetical protein [Nostoc sp. GT001]|nr:hypothetical protein [Nostoc sp. GT001]MDM9583126.1 hypothetical protein [Nostoc sp. GT001]
MSSSSLVESFLPLTYKSTPLSLANLAIAAVGRSLTPLGSK